MICSKYDFVEIASTAIKNPSQENLEKLWQWCTNFGECYWNGECFDVSFPDEPSGYRSLRPTWYWDEENEGYCFRDYELR